MKVSGQYTIHVAPAQQQPLALNPPGEPQPTPLPDEQVGSPVTGEVDIVGGTPPYELVDATGLPPGVTATLDQTGTKVIFAGVPTAAGDATIQLDVSDSGTNAPAGKAAPAFKPQG
jgi:hypothetical protein